MQRDSSQLEKLHTHLLRPKPRSRKQKIADVFWDKRYGTCLTRTPTNWFAIGIYYSAFLAGVFLILHISMLISAAVASRHGDRPEYVLDESLIGSSPSLNYFPLRNKQNILWLSSNNASNSYYVNVISGVFDEYTDGSPHFDPGIFKKCSSSPFGYDQYAPCIYIRMNRVIEWKPQPYGPNDRLPHEMPDYLKKIVSSSKVPKVWLSCLGTTPKDRDHLTENVFEFQGEPGFNASNFPFKNKADYIDPIIAIKLNTSLRNVLMSFTCTAWAKKLDVSKSKVEVSFYFE